jgi:dTDP-4-amino-4,6-dideoxygalactose transaminase
MKIPFMRLDRQYAIYKNELDQVVQSVFSSGKVLQGPDVQNFEQRLANISQAKSAIAVGSGTDALNIIMKALGLTSAGHVAVTSLSFVASASSIVNAGGVPIFLDIDDHYLSRTETVLDLLDNHPLEGIVLVHLYGQMIDTEAICRKAKSKGVFVIEDAAQALGAKHKGKAPGTYSDAACYSFDPTKVVGAYGSGGGIVTNDEQIALRCQSLRYHGQSQRGVFTEVGLNSQMHSVQAAMLEKKLDFYVDWEKKRQEIANQYTDAINSFTDFEAPVVAVNNNHIYHKYVINAGTFRDRLMRHLNERGIGTAIHYAKTLNKQPCFSQYMDNQIIDLIGVEKISQEVISLPIYPELLEEEIEYIINALKSFHE